MGRGQLASEKESGWGCGFPMSSASPTPDSWPATTDESGRGRGDVWGGGWERRQLEGNGDSFNEDKLVEKSKRRNEASSVEMLQFFFVFSPLENPQRTGMWEGGPSVSQAPTNAVQLKLELALYFANTQASHHSTWFQRHHVVVALGDAPDSGGPPQAAQARLARPAAVRLHQAVQGSVKSAHRTQRMCVRPVVLNGWAESQDPRASPCLEVAAQTFIPHK